MGLGLVAACASHAPAAGFGTDSSAADDAGTMSGAGDDGSAKAPPSPVDAASSSSPPMDSGRDVISVVDSAVEATTPDASASGFNAGDASTPHIGDGGACPAAPSGTGAQAIAALQLENAVRAKMGSPCATMVTALNTACDKHCAYYDANKSSSTCDADPHSEVSGCTDYVAVNFWQRDTAAGYAGQASFEDFAFDGNGAAAVQQWIDSVWHRTPILSPWVCDIGYGSATGCDTMDFGVGAGMTVSASLIVSYPYDGQTGVPRSFDGNEGPAPPAPPNGFPSGYPVHVWAQGVSVTTHEFGLDGGAMLSHQLITPQTSQYAQDVAILYGDAPLAAATRYRVRVAGTRQGGSSFDVSFAFTTQ